MTMLRTLTSLALLALSSLAIATPIEGPAPSGAPSGRMQPLPGALTPAMQLRIGVDSLLGFMNQVPRPTGPAIAWFLDREIAPFFDFDYMARAAAGPAYMRLSTSQRQQMAEQIKRAFLTSLATQLGSYGGQQVRYLRPRVSPDGQQAIVSMLILNPGGYYPARIDFRLVHEAAGWAVIDVAANGQSAVMYYRDAFRRQLMYRAYWERQRAMQYGR